MKRQQTEQHRKRNIIITSLNTYLMNVCKQLYEYMDGHHDDIVKDHISATAALSLELIN